MYSKCLNIDNSITLAVFYIQISLVELADTGFFELETYLWYKNKVLYNSQMSLLMYTSFRKI
jgi:hypothetical protein